jgi:uncharacterized protein (TIGR00255 family)
MQSMTGYGRHRKKVGKYHEIEVSIRTVNGRFLETRIHLPRDLSALEPKLKEILSKKVSRGTVDINIGLSGTAETEALTWNVNVDVAKQWLKATKKLAKELGIPHDISLSDALKVPDVMALQAKIGLQDIDQKQISSAFEAALDQLVTERTREGASLAKEIKRILDGLSKMVVEIESVRKTAADEIAGKMAIRMNDIISQLVSQTAMQASVQTTVQASGHTKGQRAGSSVNHGIDEARLLQEIALIQDRGDITEEISRLKEHIKNYQALLASPDDHGKKMDFYAQELLREVNTIGSKSHNAELTKLVVSAKSEVEKVREQVQNIQ